jgi:SAM-dependent methyltransferase
VRESKRSGTAELRADRDNAQGWTLYVDGAPQSHVNLADPAELTFAYQRRLGHLVDLTAHTRPRSTQQVVEVDAALTEFVRAELPWDRGWRIKVRGDDARAGLARLPEGQADLVVADVFAGARTPAHLTSTEFLAEVRRRLRPGGWYAANLADGGPLAFVRGQIATARAAFGDIALAADPAVLRGKRFGNLVLVASDEPLPVAEFTRRVATDPHPGRVEHGAALVDFAAGAPPVADAAAVRSPAPPPGVFPD